MPLPCPPPVVGKGRSFERVPEGRNPARFLHTTLAIDVVPSPVTGKRKVMAECFVPGRPQAPRKSRGERGPPDHWTSQVIDATRRLPQITSPCELDVEFVLSDEKQVWDLGYETDLDKLLKRLLDTLEATVLGPPFPLPQFETGAVFAIHARKRVAGPGEATGVRIVFRKAKPEG